MSSSTIRAAVCREFGAPLVIEELTIDPPGSDEVSDASADRVMICGSPGMLSDLKHLLESRGFAEGNTSSPGDFAAVSRIANEVEGPIIATLARSHPDDVDQAVDELLVDERGQRKRPLQQQ